MYEDFFGLSASPFELSPDPFFLFPSEKSKEALASITFAINRRKGFVVMTGEVGTGKTMMLRCLFELWEREQIPFAYFIGPRLSTVDWGSPSPNPPRETCCVPSMVSCWRNSSAA
jgi:general secretion pathway protein A